MKSASSFIASPLSAVVKTPSLENFTNRPTMEDGAFSSMYLWAAVLLSGNATAVLAAGTIAVLVTSSNASFAARRLAASAFCCATICSGLGDIRFACVSMGMLVVPDLVEGVEAAAVQVVVHREAGHQRNPLSSLWRSRMPPSGHSLAVDGEVHFCAVKHYRALFVRRLALPLFCRPSFMSILHGLLFRFSRSVQGSARCARCAGLGKVQSRRPRIAALIMSEATACSWGGSAVILWNACHMKLRAVSAFSAVLISPHSCETQRGTFAITQPRRRAGGLVPRCIDLPRLQPMRTFAGPLTRVWGIGRRAQVAISALCCRECLSALGRHTKSIASRFLRKP